MQLTLYGKPDCPLCDELKAELQVVQPTIGFTLHERNIEDNANDFARFRYLIPVLDIDGGELLFPPHTRYRLVQALQAAQARTA
jgi:glutaredoxin